jgi:hypothetical protein
MPPGRIARIPKDVVYGLALIREFWLLTQIAAAAILNSPELTHPRVRIDLFGQDGSQGICE